MFVGYAVCGILFFFFKQKTAYEMRISDWSSDVCSSDLPLRGTISEDYSPFCIDKTIERIFENGLGGELVKLWAGQAGEQDFALDAYVPAERHALVEQALVTLGYLPVQLQWQRAGPLLMPADALSQHADAYYLSLVDSGAQPQPGAAAAISGDGLGFVDELILRDGQLLVRGWAVDASGALPARIGVR